MHMNVNYLLPLRFTSASLHIIFFTSYLQIDRAHHCCWNTTAWVQSGQSAFKYSWSGSLLNIGGHMWLFGGFIVVEVLEHDDHIAFLWPTCYICFDMNALFYIWYPVHEYWSCFIICVTVDGKDLSERVEWGCMLWACSSSLPPHEAPPHQCYTSSIVLINTLTVRVLRSHSGSVAVCFDRWS